MISSLLYDLNHAPLWHRELKVRDQRVPRAASLDRLVFLALHRAGLLGAEEAQLLRKTVEEGMQATRNAVDVEVGVPLKKMSAA